MQNILRSAYRRFIHLEGVKLQTTIKHQDQQSSLSHSSQRYLLTSYTSKHTKVSNYHYLIYLKSIYL